MIIRLDDYPAGVKAPIPNYKEEYGKLLEIVENKKIPYTLGIVPYLINEEDISFLKSLQFMNIGMHGYSHDYERWENGDARAISLRDEFIDDSPQVISEKIKVGLDKLHRISNKVEVFIPPFNRCTAKVLPVLSDNNFKYITTGMNPWHPYGRPISLYGLKEITPRKKFYGRSGEIIDNMPEFNIEEDHVALHITWEYEDIPSFTKLINMIGKIYDN